MPQRIGFDLDGVIADLDRALIDIAARLFGPDQIDAAGDSVRPRLSRSQASLAWSAAVDTPDFWDTLPETEPGIVARIDREARARGWEVVFVTQRPATAGDSVEDQTRRWLARHGCPDAQLVVSARSRGAIAHELSLDWAVDDRPDNCAGIVAESSARALLVWRAQRGTLDEGAVAPGVRVVATAAEALDCVADEG